MTYQIDDLNKFAPRSRWVALALAERLIQHDGRHWWVAGTQAAEQQRREQAQLIFVTVLEHLRCHLERHVRRLEHVAHHALPFDHGTAERVAKSIPQQVAALRVGRPLEEGAHRIEHEALAAHRARTGIRAARPPRPGRPA